MPFVPIRPFNPRQARENHAFLEALRGAGNARLAARLLGVNRSTFIKRRARCAAFAAEWDMALAAADAALGGRSRAASAEPSAVALVGDGALRTRGGEPVIVRLANGRVQLRRAQPGRMTAAAHQAFLTALAASANVRLAAAAAGFAHSSFYARCRAEAGFAEQMAQALRVGYDRVEWAALDRAIEAAAGEGEPSPWYADALARPLPPMSVGQAFQLLCQHRNTVRLGYKSRVRKPSVPMESNELRALLTHRLELVCRAEHYQATGQWPLDDQAPQPAPAPEPPAPAPEPPAQPAPAPEPPAPEPPDPRPAPAPPGNGWPSHVQPGIAAARAGPVHNPGKALFGGWRLADWKHRNR